MGKYVSNWGEGWRVNICLRVAVRGKKDVFLLVFVNTEVVVELFFVV